MIYALAKTLFMKKIAFLLIFLTTVFYSSAQKKSEWKNLKETEQIVKFLASDELAGRFPFTPGIDKAADFIANEFKKAGLQPWDGKSFLQPFTIDRVQFVSASSTIDGEQVDEKNIFAFSLSDLITLNERSNDFDTAYISKNDNLYSRFKQLRIAQEKNLVIFVDTIHKNAFRSRPLIYGFLEEKPVFYDSDKDAIAILTEKRPETWSIEVRQKTEKKKLQNVVGMLQGKSLQRQKIVFSAHYDHLGIRTPDNSGDSIYNGANDDASGVAAIIQLAYHFAMQKNNERSLVFAAFTSEETGGFGGIYFTKQYDSSLIVADFNIEMIGSRSEKGVGAADITGYEHSDFGKILQKNIDGSSYKFYPDTLNRFYLSDNITLAMKGIPAHTISSSRGSREPYYHTPDDEWDKLDYNNMNEVIKAIALSATSIISGKDTPSRTDPAKLQR